MPDRVTLPPFELATFVVNDVVEGSPSRWDAGRLHVDRAALVSSASDPALAEIHLEVVRPGDAVRVANVLDAVLPDVKAADPERTFPGALGALVPGGHGRTNRVGGLGVLSVCDWLAAGYTTRDEFPDSFVDMDGPGARLTRWGSTTNVVMRCVPAEGAPVADVDRARAAGIAADRARHRGHDDRPGPRLRGDVLRTGPGCRSRPAGGVRHPPGRVGGSADRHVPLRARRRGDRSHGARSARGAGRRVDERRLRLAGRPQRHRDLPRLVALVRTLLAAHGERLRFAGLILALGYLDGSFEKQRSAMLSARLARLARRRRGRSAPRSRPATRTPTPC